MDETGGRIFEVRQGAGDVVGFDPARDKLDLGDVSVHNFIVVDTAAGVGFLNPWSGETTLVRGVSLGQLTVDSFLPVINDHLRQCLAGALAWAHGVEAEPGVVHARSHEPGRIDRVAFDPATDRVDFRHYGSREQISMTDGAEGVVIANAGTGQALILLDVTVDQLSASHFLFYSAQVREDRVHQQLGLGDVPAAQVVDQGMPVPGTLDWPTAAGPGDPPPGAEGVTYALEWRWGEHVALDFDPAVDRLDFGWFKAHEFAVEEVDGAVVVSIVGNQQSYTLTGVPLSALEMGAIVARDPSAREAWQAVLDGAEPEPEPRPEPEPVDEPPELRIGNAKVEEGDAGWSVAKLKVRLSEASDAPVTLDWATRDRSARAGEDYLARSGTLTFEAGETVKTLRLKVRGDEIEEGDEAFVVTLTGVAGARLADGVGRVKILDDDAAAPPPPPPPSEGEVAYAVRDAWAGGFVAEMTVEAGASGLDGWTVSFDAGFEIANLWNARILSHEGSRYVLGNMDYNAEVAAGATVGFGFQASGEGSDLSGLDLNGAVPPTASPAISVVGAEAVEGGALVFDVSLSSAAAETVTVRYATEDGTARAGDDYVAAAGTLSFAPGETRAQVRVETLDDDAAEPVETLALALDAPAGATLGASRAQGAIVDDDPAPLPGIGIGDAEAVEGDGLGASPGWFSTSGNQVVDADGTPVRIAGVNWFGFESPTMAPHGLWTRGYAEMMDQMKAEGFNTIRLPFSSEMLHTSAAPNGIDFSKNPDLAGLSAVEILDVIVDYAGEIGMRIILDHHRSTAGAGTSGNGLWFGEGGFTEAGWIADWRMLAARYADDPTVIGADLHNEPHGGTWGGGGARDWARAAEAAGDAIGEVNPNWLILVEGVGAYRGDPYWWGGALQGVRDRPIDLAVENKLVYSPHDYPNSIHAQPWFQGEDFADGLPEVFREAWGFIFEEEIAPVMLGEFGTRLQDPKDAPWLAALTAYLQGDFDGDGTSELGAGEEGIGWTWWSWNPNSGDTGGILADDWRTVLEEKMAWLEPMRFDFAEDGGGGDAVFEVSLTAPAQEAVSVDWRTAPGTAGAEDFAQASGTLVFAPGERTREIRVEILGDDRPEADERFAVLLSNPRGAEILEGEGRGLILDDDGAGAAGLLLA